MLNFYWHNFWLRELESLDDNAPIDRADSVENYNEENWRNNLYEVAV